MTWPKQCGISTCQSGLVFLVFSKLTIRTSYGSAGGEVAAGGQTAASEEANEEGGENVQSILVLNISIS